MRRRTVLQAGGLALAAVSTAGAAPTGAAAPRVLLLGDSLTYGQSTPTVALPGGFRDPLHGLLRRRHRFVGSRRDNPSAGLTAHGQDAHEGWPGLRVDQFTGVPLPESDVAVVLLGTNDVGQRHDPRGRVDAREPASVRTFAARLANRLDGLLEALPARQVVLCVPPPYLRDPADRAPDVVSAAAAAAVGGLAARRRLPQVDLYALCLQRDGAVDRALVGEDGTHLTDTGYHLVAARLAPVLDATLARAARGAEPSA